MESDTMTSLELHSRIVSLAQDANISISQLERNAGFAIGTIKAWKKSFPAADKILKVAECLNISIDYLFGRTDNIYSHKFECYSNAILKILRAAEINEISETAANVIVSVIESLNREYGKR